MKMQKYSEQFIKEFRDEYLSGNLLVKDITKKFGITISTVRYLRKKHNINERTEKLGLRRKYSLDEYYFERIDTPEKAYNFGIMCTDGCVYKTNYKEKRSGKIRAKYAIRLHIAAKDRILIENFKKSINSGHPIKEINMTGFSKGPGLNLDINSKKMVNDLIKNGCGTNKTHKINWPESVPEEFKRDLLRGSIDGDGSNIVDKKTHKRIAIKLCGSYSYCRGARDWLYSKLHSGHPKISFRSNIYHVCWNGRVQASKIFHLIYDNATVYLSRKKEAIEPYVYSLKEISLKPTYEKTFLTGKQQWQLIKDYKNNILELTEIQEKYNISHSTIDKILDKYGVKRNRTTHIIPIEIKTNVLDDHNRGISKSQILDKYKISSTSYGRIIKDGRSINVQENNTVYDL
jgi:predicted DNA-binding protein YlxM (UPF0122 family)